MIPFEPAYLPGYSPNERRRALKKRRCPYAPGSKRKAKWRAALRKWRRKKKRRARKAKLLLENKEQNIESKSKSTTKSKLSSAAQARKDKRKKKKKRRKLHKKKIRMRRHREKRHLLASKTRKQMVMARGKMTKDQILRRLMELKQQRINRLFEFQKYRALTCSPKRKAIRHLRYAAKRARRRRKKYKRFIRFVKRDARKDNVEEEEKKKVPKPPRVHFAQNPNVERPQPSKRVEYENIFPYKATLHKIELKSEEKHLKEKEKAMIDNLPIYCKTDAIGDFGRVQAKIFHVVKEHMIFVDFRWQVQLTHDKSGSKEARILAKLAMLETPNSLRIIQYGQYLNLQYVITPLLRTNLMEIIETYPKMDISVAVHLIHQTFRCVRDLHKVGYAHLQINPSAFSVQKNNSDLLVINNFEFASTREGIRSKSIWFDEEGRRDIHQRRNSKKPRLPFNHIQPYMSRGQHFRLVKGTSDDYESWFYVCARILNGKPLSWEKETNHMAMADAKYEFVKEYTHPDPFTNYKMKTVHQYCLSANHRNHLKIGYFLEKVLQDWKDRKPVIGLLPWQKQKEEEDKKKETEEWMRKNKKWMVPKSERQ